MDQPKAIKTNDGFIVFDSGLTIGRDAKQSERKLFKEGNLVDGFINTVVRREERLTFSDVSSRMENSSGQTPIENDTCSRSENNTC